MLPGVPFFLGKRPWSLAIIPSKNQDSQISSAELFKFDLDIKPWKNVLNICFLSFEASRGEKKLNKSSILCIMFNFNGPSFVTLMKPRFLKVVEFEFPQKVRAQNVITRFYSQFFLKSYPITKLNDFFLSCFSNFSKLLKKLGSIIK